MIDWFKEHSNGFSVFKWPPHSPDLNIVEHFCSVVDREIQILDVQPTSQEDAIIPIRNVTSEHRRNSMKRNGVNSKDNMGGNPLLEE